MFAQERKNLIVKHLQTHGRATVTELSKLVGSAESTIRRDLQELEERGQLERTHGGAVFPVESTLHEPTWQEKVVQNAEAKERIAHAAVEMVHDGDTIILDAGTTTVHIARNIKERNVTVVTNSIAIATELSMSETVQLVLLGGDLRKATGALVGPLTEQILSQMHVDMVFLGANGLHDGGVTTPTAVEAATKRAMLKTAKRVVVASELSKIGQISFIQVCSWADVDGFVTDGDIQQDSFRQKLLEHGVTIYTP